MNEERRVTPWLRGVRPTLVVPLDTTEEKKKTVIHLKLCHNKKTL